MIGKKCAKMLLAGVLALVLAGCGGKVLSQFPVETRAPVVLEPPVVVEPQTQPDATGNHADMICAQARRRAETFGYLYGIKNDGTVVLREITERNAAGDYVPVDVSHWMDIVAVVTDSYAGVVGLRSDGTIVTTQPDTDEARIMSGWTDVIEIHTYFSDVVALRADGTVLTTMDGLSISDWEEVVQISASFFGLFGLRSDGTVLTDNPEMVDISGWTDVVQLATGMDCVLGLRSDGTVLAASQYGDVQQYVKDWTDIVAIDVYMEIFGLRADGTVVCTDNVIAGFMEEMGEEMDLSGWTDVVAIDTWGASFIGLRSDGTLLSGGMDEGGQLDVGHWRNIKAFKIDNYTTFALQEDGTLLMTGYGDEVLWTDIRCPGE